MLKVSIAFVFGAAADPVRKSVFDQLVLATLLGADAQSATLAEVSHKVADGLGCEPFPDSQIGAALRRLEARGLVAAQDERYSLTDNAVSKIGGATAEANSLSVSLVSDVVERVCEVSGLSVSREERNKLERNAKDVLAELFRLMGLELAHQFLETEMPSPLYLESSDRILAVAKRQTSETLGELLIAALADVIKNPGPEQSRMLANWARAYLGVVVMNLDPALREFQTTRLRQKVFILDTDFVVRCIVREDPESEACLALVQRLVHLGCRVIVPEAVVHECATHAELSPRTYHFFGSALHGLTSAFVERKVNNAFVKGYYYGREAGLLPRRWPYEEYLANYYDPANPQRFVRDVIIARLPSSVEIVDAATLLSGELPVDLIERVSAELLTLLERSPKSEYRTREQNNQLATTDARLFITALHLNPSGVSRNPNGRILGGSCYIVTNSSRYLRAAKVLGIRDVITTRPQKLLALVELATGPVVDDIAFASLFENPLLIHAVEHLWPDVRLLLTNGIALTGKSLVRLKWDLDRTLHDRISVLKTADEAAEGEGESAPLDAGDREYVELVREVSSLGYSLLHPALESLREALAQVGETAESERVAREQLQTRYDALAEGIERFGKKKQRYLRRVMRRQERDHE